MRLKTGDAAPGFSLMGVDGKTHSLSDFDDKEVLIIFFTCNHCPYAKAYEDRLITLQHDFLSKSVQFVAINSNDSEGYPEDSFENMKIRASEKNFPYPYLRDKSQEVARAYGGEVTPDCFVFDKERKLRYSGRVDDDWQDPNSVTSQDLRNAIQAALDGKEIEEPELRAVGCTIKWK